MSVPSKGLKSNVSWKVNSHLIQDPPKHVHQNYLIKLKKCSKTLANFPCLGMGGLSRWPIEWVIPQLKGCFLGGPSPSHVRKMEWMGFIPLGMTFMTYNGFYYLIYWFLCRECATPSFQCIHFPSLFIGINLFKFKTIGYYNWVT